MSVPDISVVGTGAVARAIARRHADAGGRVTAVASRDLARAARLAARWGAAPARADTDLGAADVVIVAVADRAVAEVGARLRAALLSPGPVVMHTSGALPASALGGAPLRTGSLHPLQSLPSGVDDDDSGDGRLAARLGGCHWFHEGDGGDEARSLVAAWGGHLHTLAPGAKILYHAAAATVSNHTVALFDAATQMLAAAGIAPEDAQAPLAALLEGTLRNLRDIGTPGALTGPVARGDVGTVEGHLDAVRRAAPHLVASYVEMALLALDVAVRRGSVDAPTAGRLRRALRG